MGMEVQINSLEDMCSLMCDNTIPDHRDYVYCLRCGRRLISQEAKQKGYGKTCEKKMKAESKMSLF